ncbi:MAG: hypothetical protein ACL93V_09595 [Candidatus Electrothrix sp. YB6]
MKLFSFLSSLLRYFNAERLAALIQQEPFDYTKWRGELDEEEGSIEEISQKAMALRKNED